VSNQLKNPFYGCQIGQHRKDEIRKEPILYAGDTLWAALIYWMIRFFKPSSTPWVSAIMALAFAFAIEISQLYQAPWINEIRSTTLGALVFGFGFLVSDLVCYAVGVGVGFLLDNLARTSKLSKIISSN